jgi:Transglutaminase-like superfamily
MLFSELQHIYTVQKGHKDIVLDLQKNKYLATELDDWVSWDETHVDRSGKFLDSNSLTFKSEVELSKVPRFVSSCVYANRLKSKPIGSILAELRNKLVNRVKSNLANQDPEVILMQAAQYRRLCVLRWSNYLCLEDSIAAFQFLLPLTSKIKFTIGVDDDPFLAHAWVSIGNTVLNDSFAVTSRYKPICYVSDQDLVCNAH